jgi:hypothetical protein
MYKSLEINGKWIKAMRTESYGMPWSPNPTFVACYHNRLSQDDLEVVQAELGYSEHTFMYMREFKHRGPQNSLTYMYRWYCERI